MLVERVVWYKWLHDHKGGWVSMLIGDGLGSRADVGGASCGSL